MIRKGCPDRKRIELKSSNDVQITIRVDTGKSPRFIGDFTQDDVTRAFQAAVAQEITRKRQNGIPIAKYDGEAKRACLAYPDGSREYVSD